ncbi:hypothetical protein GCM10009037_03340 [Halarchaeum grantii]|uniref:Uncharacterized protein n=1 Tax=Halarchaeum grantii TaxID=1193105 RepID=A0A830ERV1_9EURY|nr:hypothetical protein [Halarchaeum grantii]GGL23195.1 hypothetical protein GCM10009037_03340 [Halarchaeum grantii]
MIDNFDEPDASQGEALPMDFERVIDFSGHDWWVSRDKTYGLYCQYAGDGWDDDDLELVRVEWSYEFKRRGFYDGRDSPYLLYERDGSNGWEGDGENRSYRSHIVQGGATICRTDANIPSPEIIEGEKRVGLLPREVPYPTFDTLTPLSEVPEDWRESVPLCTHCMEQSQSSGILPGHEESASCV